MQMTSLTFYGGVNEIGGNKILLEDQDTKVFLDFGMSFGQSGKYFSEFHQPRKCNCIGDFLFTGLLPELEGVYRTDYLEYMDRPGEERGVDAVLLSHAHMDHVAYIHHLRKDIPLHMSPETYAILKTMEETGTGTFTEILHHKQSFAIRPKKRGEGHTRVKGGEAESSRPVNIFDYGSPFKVGPLEIVPHEVDHSLPGATAYIIHTSEGTILYTGDFRFHGYKRDATEAMIDSASEENIEAVIVEGTRINEETGNTETDVFNEAGTIIEETTKLAVVNFPARDLARLLTFHRIAEKTGRKLVLNFKHAYLLEQFQALGDDYPKISDPSLCFFADRKGWGIFGRDDYPETIAAQDYKRWERNYLDLPNTITYREVKRNQSEYMFYCTYYQLNELIDVRPETGSRYVRSICEPFNHEMLFDEKRVNNWLNLYGLGPAYQVHASGHASGPEIMEMLERIAPEKIYPVHTEHPQHLKGKFSRVQHVETGVAYTL
jgi:ribonuclease J